MFEKFTPKRPVKIQKKDGLWLCPPRRICIIMSDEERLSCENPVHMLRMLHVLHMSNTYPKKTFGIKATGTNSFHRLRGGSTPSKREVWGFAGQGLRPCRRLDIGALRSPLSPFAHPLEDAHITPGAGHTKKIQRNIPLHPYGESISHSSALMRRMPS